MSDLDLFAEVKKIDLLAHIQTHYAAVPVVPGAATTHCNPCPVCGHNDGFTFYAASNSWCCYCGGCDRKGGSIVDLEMKRQGIPALDAAKYLAGLYGIGGAAPIATRQSPITNHQSPIQKPAPPAISRDRAITLRNFMADYYHTCLLNNPEALRYQTETRGHSMDLLHQEKVGWSPGDWSFSKAIKDMGYTDDDLFAISLLAPHTDGKPGYYLTCGRGMFVYPHRDADGNTLHFTKKDPAKKSKAQPPKAGADPDWLMFGQSAIDAPEYWLVEGENDRLTLMEHGLQFVAAIIGNTRVKEIIERVTATCAGKTIYLAFDPDDAGRKYEKKFSAAITQAGGTAKTLMASLATFNMDIDDILMKAENPAGLLAEMAKNAKTITVGRVSNPATAGASSPPANPEAPESGEPFKFQSFNVLGEKINNDIAFWSMTDGKAKVYSIAIEKLTLDRLYQIGGEEIAIRVCRTKTDENDQRLLFTTVKKNLILQANKVQLGKMETLVQGIHTLSRGRLLLVNGKQGWIFENNTLTLHQYPLIERKFMAFEEGEDWVDPEALAEALKGMNRERAFATLTKLLELLGQWTFEGPMDPLTIAGFILAQIIQTAWTWRPHIWVNGTQGSGKSKLLRLIKSIFGKLVMIHEGNATSEAGLRQSMNDRNLMTYIDEFEDNKERDKIIEILRTCGGGGGATKGSANQSGAVTYNLKHMVMVCSVEVGLKRAAEKNRYLIVATKKERGHKTPEPPSSATCEDLKNNLVALALWGMAEARELVRTVGQVGPDIQDTRFVESVAAPYAMIAVCTDNPRESLHANLKSYLAEYEIYNKGDVMEDEETLLQDIIMAKVRISTYQEETSGAEPRIIHVERTVGQILAQDPLPEDHHKNLQASGIRIRDDGSLFIAHEQARRELLGKTRWRDLNILQILSRIPGSEYKQKKLAGTRVYGVVIPESVWRK